MPITMAELEAQVAQQIALINELSERTAAIRARVTSEDEAVTVTVDATGALLELELSDRIASLTRARFEQTFLATVNEAARQAFTERAGLVSSFNDRASGVNDAPGTLNETTA